MVFQGKSATAICEQMKDPARNHGKSLAIVLWGWAPGGARTLPPISHDQFVTLFKAWVDGGGACP